jgi:thioredoxin-like negative regulator of GroEL
VSELDFDEVVMKSDIPVFIDVSTEWCPPCKVARPVVAELARRHAGKLKVVELDGDTSPELAARLCVRGFPTFIGVVHGEIVDRKLGFAGANPLETLAQCLLAAARTAR